MADFSNQVFELPQNIPIYTGRLDFVIRYSQGKKVLHLGCVDEGMIDRKKQNGLWLHEQLLQVTESLWGVDVDETGIEQMRSYGIQNLFLADIEEISSIPDLKGQEFDLILLTEVLEHVDNPGRFLEKARAIFHPHTEMLITVPNATSIVNLISLWGGKESVHPDHNYWFSWHTILSLFNKYGFDIKCIGVYTQLDYRRSIIKRLLAKFLNLFGYQSKAPALQQASPRNRNNAPGSIINLAGWFRMVTRIFTYRLFLGRNPFFADGLIFIAKPAPNQF